MMHHYHHYHHYITMSCPICLDSLDDLQLYETNCLHIFHKTCFDKGSFIKCPICRTELIDYDNYYKLYCSCRDELLDDNITLLSWLKHKIDTIKYFYDNNINHLWRIFLFYLMYDTIINLIEYKEFLPDEYKRFIYNKPFITVIYDKLITENIDASKYEIIIKNHLNSDFINNRA